MFFVYAFFAFSGTYTGDYNSIISDSSSSCIVQDAIFDNFDLRSNSQSLISIGSTSTTLRITTTTFFHIQCSFQGDIYTKGPTTLEKTCATQMENTVTAAFLKHENTNIQMTYVSVTDSPSTSNKIIIDSKCNGNFQYVNVSDVYAPYASLNYLLPSQPIKYSELINSSQTNQALFVQTTNGKVDSCIFYKNNGPACFIEKITGSIISNSYFMDNKLDLLFISSTVTVTNCYFWDMSYSGSAFSVSMNVHTYGAGFPENFISNDPNWGKANYKCDYYTFQPPTWVNLPLLPLQSKLLSKLHFLHR
ncbi:hypothetical protein TVAG_078620 [Trichomonas vaginalis G3]|uniref:Uncharacterized protein n=1 Tax=Trichomonas vaginalis (strain ATCC PRA-98 / G3) TaxID=412133 RepID=A2FIV8_TRIV3|nr:pectin lyase-like family [Trichomonas vaginalis G3]EAX95173.1 hypothetical protein TVAG_078620 [Trichomonas vaginalis G3]KAI5514505.1 pectin lyase-like family [Trichomonas vaginalis G3]|eukprot:XP_001308103.1 hypothetical protein [Trichomonas vaginalis G3]